MFFVTRQALSPVPPPPLVGGGLGDPPRRQFSNLEVLKRYFQRFMYEKSTSNKCEKAGVFGSYKFLFLRSC